MKKIFTFCFLLLTLTVHAQQHTADSLKKVIASAKDDTIKILAISKLSRSYADNKPDTAVLIARQGILLSKKEGYIKGEAANLSVEGTAFYRGGDYAAAINSYVNALKIAQQIQDDPMITKNLLGLGNIADAQGDENLSVKYSMEAKRLAESNHNATMIEYACANLGDSYEKLNKLDSARIYTQQAYEQAVSIKDIYEIAVTSNNLGNIYSKMNNADIALGYYRTAIPFGKKADDGVVLAETTIGMAKLFKRLKRQDSSLYYARLSMATAVSGNLKSYILGAGRFLNDYFDEKGQTDSAYHYRKIADKANEEIFSQEKTKEVQNQAFEEQQREQEMAEQKLAQEEQSRKNLQLAGIAVFIPSFFLFVLLLSRRRAKPRTVEFLIILALLMFFEFITLLLHPYIDKLTNDTPAYSLMILVAIAALIVPLHHRAEHWVKTKLVDVKHHEHPAKEDETK